MTVKYNVHRISAEIIIFYKNYNRMALKIIVIITIKIISNRL
jgi:hypothetical protein